jgi:hypothetical protein
VTGNVDANQRFLEATAETADTREMNFGPASVDGIGKSMVNTLGSVSPPTGSHSDGDTRDWGLNFHQSRFADGVEDANILNARH